MATLPITPAVASANPFIRFWRGFERAVDSLVMDVLLIQLWSMVALFTVLAWPA